MARRSKAATLGGMIMFTMIGLVFAVTGTVLLIKSIRERALCTVESTGIVTDIREHKSTKTNKKTHKKTTKISYAPVVEYDFNGKQYKYTSSTYTSNKRYSKGETVKIMVNADTPTQIYIVGDSAEHIMYYTFIGLGAVFTLVGVAGGVTMLRRRRIRMY